MTIYGDKQFMCGSCNLWGGKRHPYGRILPAPYAISNNDERGTCYGGGFSGLEMHAIQGCGKWQLWAAIQRRDASPEQSKDPGENIQKQAPSSSSYDTVPPYNSESPRLTESTSPAGGFSDGTNSSASSTNASKPTSQEGLAVLWMLPAVYLYFQAQDAGFSAWFLLLPYFIGSTLCLISLRIGILVVAMTLLAGWGLTKYASYQRGQNAENVAKAYELSCENLKKVFADLKRTEDVTCVENKAGDFSATIRPPNFRESSSEPYILVKAVFNCQTACLEWEERKIESITPKTTYPSHAIVPALMGITGIEKMSFNPWSIKEVGNSSSCRQDLRTSLLADKDTPRFREVSTISDKGVLQAEARCANTFAQVSARENQLFQVEQARQTATQKEKAEKVNALAQINFTSREILVFGKISPEFMSILKSEGTGSNVEDRILAGARYEMVEVDLNGDGVPEVVLKNLACDADLCDYFVLKRKPGFSYGHISYGKFRGSLGVTNEQVCGYSAIYSTSKIVNGAITPEPMNLRTKCGAEAPQIENAQKSASTFVEPERLQNKVPNEAQSRESATKQTDTVRASLSDYPLADVTQRLGEILDATKSGNDERVTSGVEAVTQLSRPARGDRKIARAANTLGLAAMEKGAFLDAVTHFTSAIIADPADQEIVDNLAGALLKSSRFSEAREAAKAALLLNPMRSSAWANLGTILAEEGKEGSAVASFQLAYRFSRSADKTREYLEKMKQEDGSARVREAVSKTLLTLPAPATSAKGSPQSQAPGFDRSFNLQWAEADNDSDVNWNEAVRYCATKGNGWRLPTSAELQASYESGHSTPCFAHTCKISSNSRLTGNFYWSNESNGSSEAWGLSLRTGYRGGYPVEYRSFGNRALCVRRP